jgi:hypothetical protein
MILQTGYEEDLRGIQYGFIAQGFRKYFRKGYRELH